MTAEQRNGAKTWFVADGWMPTQNPELDSGYEGHEAIMILNCHDRPANVLMDVYFQDREPQTGVPLTVAARRITCLRMDHPAEIGGIQIPRRTQYALRFQSDIDVVIQYGRMDVTQANLAYIGMMGLALQT